MGGGVDNTPPTTRVHCIMNTTGRKETDYFGAFSLFQVSLAWDHERVAFCAMCLVSTPSCSACGPS